MYDEVGECYEEKRIRMLQAHNMEIKQRFHRHLIAGFGNRPPPRSSIANRIKYDKNSNLSEKSLF